MRIKQPVLQIKVCGMREPENIKALNLLKPNYIGFIFYPFSTRYVGVEFTKNDLIEINPEVKKTGVFVNATEDEVIEFSTIYAMQAVQLHGSESALYCKTIKDAGFEVIKAFGVGDDFDFELLNSYKNEVDYFLFDTKTPVYGGSGKSFNWQVLNKYSLDIPFFISGGLSSDNIEQAIKIAHPQFYGLDLNSKFEIAPALKDIVKLKNAFLTIRNVN